MHGSWWAVSNLGVLDYEGVKEATPEVLRPKRKSSAHFTMT